MHVLTLKQLFMDGSVKYVHVTCYNRPFPRRFGQRDPVYHVIKTSSENTVSKAAQLINSEREYAREPL